MRPLYADIGGNVISVNRKDKMPDRSGGHPDRTGFHCRVHFLPARRRVFVQAGTGHNVLRIQRSHPVYFPSAIAGWSENQKHSGGSDKRLGYDFSFAAWTISFLCIFRM